MEDYVQTLNTIWPMLIATIGLICVLAKMHYAIEVLKEKVKVLFELHNKDKPQ